MAAMLAFDAETGRRELMAVARDALLIVDCATQRILEANPAAEALFGVAPGALLAMSFDSLFTRSRHAEDIFARHRDFVPLRFLRGAGERHPAVEIAVRYFAGGGGELAAVALRDVSGRIQRERIENESERKYQSLFEASPYPVLILGTQGAIVDANRCALLYYGYEHEELLRLDWQVLDPGSRATGFSMRPTMAGAREHRRKDGSGFMAEVMFSYFRLRGQSLILALVRDVTEHWRTFRQLQESEARWRFAIEGSGDAMIDWPLIADGSHVFSPLLSAMLGYDPDTDAGTDADGWRERVHADDRPGLEAAMRAHLQGLEPLVQAEYRVRERSGSYRWLALRAKIMPVDGGSRRLIGAVRDIHESRMRKLQEAAEQNKIFRLERLATAGEMLSALAHEVNQPLTAISNFGAIATHQVARGDATETIARSLSAITEQALRAGEIVRRIREFVRRAEPSVRPTGINALISRVAGWMENEARASGVRIVLDLDLGLPEVSVDVLQIEQVLLNLLRNGVEAMHGRDAGDEALLEVRSRFRRGGVQVSVRDHGSGIDAATAGDMFEPFVSTKPAGMGLGLAICRTVVDNHGGRLWADPADDGEGGAVFHFILGEDASPVAEAIDENE